MILVKNFKKINKESQTWAPFTTYNNAVLYIQVMRNRESITRISTQVIVSFAYTWLFFYTCLKSTILRLVYPRLKKKKNCRGRPGTSRQGFCKKEYHPSVFSLATGAPISNPSKSQTGELAARRRFSTTGSAWLQHQNQHQLWWLLECGRSFVVGGLWVQALSALLWLIWICLCCWYRRLALLVYLGRARKEWWVGGWVRDRLSRTWTRL